MIILPVAVGTGQLTRSAIPGSAKSPGHSVIKQFGGLPSVSKQGWAAIVDGPVGEVSSFRSANLMRAAFSTFFLRKNMLSSTKD